MSRTKNTVRNTVANFSKIMLSVILSFVVRTVFISVLGKEYLGINGLYSNIFTILNLTELGLGTAISFRLYKPLAVRDEERVRILIKFYRAAYRVISIVILIIGITIMPFLKFIIKDEIPNINIYLIYLLYLFQTVASYTFFAYKSTLLKADQQERKIAMIEIVVDTGISVLQIVFLYLFRDFITYVVLLVISNLVKNLLISLKVDKEYPFISIKTENRLHKDEIKLMFKDLGAVSLYKINTVVLSATDNIVISTFLGISSVGLYSNYLLLLNTLKRILNTFYNALNASIGNLHASDDSDHEYVIFSVINLITAILFGLASIGIYVISNHFINIWIGENYLLPKLFTLLFAIEFYLRGVQIFLANFRTSMGLFQQAKYRPIFSILINLILSIILVQKIGIYGVTIGTSVAILTTSMWYDPKILHKFGFNRSSKNYFTKNVYYTFTIIVTGFITNYIIGLIEINSIYSLLLSMFICVVLSSFLLFILLLRTWELKYIIDIIRSKIKHL